MESEVSPAGVQTLCYFLSHPTVEIQERIKAEKSVTHVATGSGVKKSDALLTLWHFNFVEAFF